MIVIAVESEEDPWVIGGQRRSIEAGHLMFKPSEVRDLSVFALRVAFAAFRSLYAGSEEPVAVVYNGGDEQYFDVDAPYHRVDFVLHEQRIALSIELSEDDCGGLLWASGTLVPRVGELASQLGQFRGRVENEGIE